jgi:ElaB/YqjD/DUF883 family membrane-anchored ribosome-binding protein
MKNMDNSKPLDGSQLNGRQPDNRAPEEIERDIQRTREEVSSTIEAIQSKLTPGQMMDQAITYARHSLPADFGSNLGNSVRENPLPVTLIGIGIAWLMMSGQRGRTQGYGRPGRDYEAAYDSSYDTTYGAAYGGDASPAYSYDEADEGSVHRALGKAGAAGRDMKDKVSESSQHLKERVSSGSQHMKEKASHMTQKASDMTHRAKERASDLGHRSQQNYYRAKDRFGHLLDEQPLVVGALGIALGASLGAAMPRTRREDQLMGNTRDSLLDQAKQTATEQAGKVQQAAGRVMQEAKADADTTGGATPAGDTRNAGIHLEDEDERPILVETKGNRPAGTDGAGSSQQSLH